jgi:TatD DNase family protein
VDIGVEPGDLAARFALAGARPFLRYSAGIWPGGEALSGGAATAAALAALEADLEAAPRLGAALCAIGECGLDYHYGEDPAAQARLFSAQIALARRTGLPLIVHSREAFADTLSILGAEAGGLKVVIHCFGYGPAEVEAFLSEGFFVSFAGNLTYKKSEALREALKLVPAESLLLETDSPYMNPEPRRGKPCSPAEIARTYECAADLRGVSVEVLAGTVSANARLLFGPAISC